MIPVASLWLPILVSSITVFVASSLVHMAFKWHNADYRKLPNEDEVRDAVRRGNPTPGLYVFPRCADMKEMQTPEMQAKFEQGPNGLLTILPNGAPRMGVLLGQWFALTLLVGILTAAVAAIALPAGASDARVFRVAGLVALLAYGAGTLQESIWMGRSWRSSGLYLLDAAIYAAATGTIFAWLWPAS